MSQSPDRAKADMGRYGTGKESMYLSVEFSLLSTSLSVDLVSTI